MAITVMKIIRPGKIASHGAICMNRVPPLFSIPPHVGVGGGVLPPTVSPPFRLAAADWAIVDDTGYVHRHAFDRFFVAMHLEFMELTVGRQAIGLGRGVMFFALRGVSASSSATQPSALNSSWAPAP